MWTRAYNLPEHTGMLVERLEENIVRYRVCPLICWLDAGFESSPRVLSFCLWHEL